MTQLSKYNRHFLNDFFDDLVTPGYYIKPLHGDGVRPDFKVDIKEDAQNFVVNAEIPGVKKEDIHISVDNGVLSIAAEVKQEDRQTDNEKLLRSERYYGSVSRSFTLGADIDQSAAEANYESGILSLKLPKKTKAAPNRIQIK